jgi:hypothetical protein
VTDNEFADYLNNLRFEPEAVTYNAIVMYPQFPDFATCASYGADYVEIYYQVGGVFWTLCNEDWTGALEMLGLETAGLKKEYFLTERPVEGTIEVSVEYLGYIIGFVEYDQASLTGDWIYNTERNSVTFVAYVPEPDAIVHIDYDVLAAVEAE